MSHGYDEKGSCFRTLMCALIAGHEGECRTAAGESCSGQPGKPIPTTSSEGKKFDVGKLRWSLLPPGAVENVIRVLEHGAKKYGEHNWQKVTPGRQRYYDAVMRHMEAWWGGQKLDPDSGLPHLAHAACSIAFLLWFDDQERK